MKSEEGQCGMGKAGVAGTLQPSSKGSSAFRQELIIPGSSQCPYVLLSSHSQLYAYLPNPLKS